MESLSSKIAEAGRVLMISPLSGFVLQPHLDNLEELLKKVAEKPDLEMEEALKQPMDALVSTDLLEHPLTDVRLSVAYSLCEIIRITAPKSPLDIKKMKSIFECIVSSLEDQPYIPSQSKKRVPVLKSLFKLRSYFCLGQRVLADLCVKLFEIFLNSGSLFSDAETRKLMKDIMEYIIEKSDLISHDLVKSLLESIENKRESACIAEELLQMCAKKLQPNNFKSARFFPPYIVKYLSSVVKKTPETAVAIQKPFENETESDDMPLKQSSKKGKTSKLTSTSSEDDVGNRDGDKQEDGKKQGGGKKDHTTSLSANDGGRNVSKVGAKRNVDEKGLSTATKGKSPATKTRVKEIRVDVDALPKTAEEGPNKIGGMRISFSSSEDYVFSVAVTEFSDNDNDEKIGESEITACDLSESNVELTETSLVKDGVSGPTPEPSHNLRSQEIKSVDVMETKEEKGEETKEVKDPDLTRRSTETSAVVDENLVNVKQVNFEKLESSITDGNSEIMKHEIISDCEHVREVVNYETAEETNIGGLHLEKDSNKRTHEVIENTVSVLNEKQDLGKLDLDKSSSEQIQEVVKQPDTALTEKEALGGAHLEEQLNEHNHEVVERADPVLTDSQDLGAPEVEKCSKEHLKEPNLIMTEKEDLGALKLVKCSKDEVIEHKDSSVVADVVYGKNASDVVHVPNIEGKINNHDSGAALSIGSSTGSSLEGNWRSVSVLSTASMDGGTLQSTEKSKVNTGKSNAATADVFQPQSLRTLMELESKDEKLESKDEKPESSNVSQKQPNSEISQAGRKKNEEVIAKVTNWSTGKHSTRLNNLLGEFKSPSGAQPVQKDEAIVISSVSADMSSPPRMINDDKKGRKKVKGLNSWVRFVCCSSVNVVN